MESKQKDPSLWPFVLPLLVFLLLGLLEPRFDLPENPAPENDAVAAETKADTSQVVWYVVVYGCRIIAVTLLLVYFRGVYLRHFRWYVTRDAITFGVVGAVIWIGICWLNPERYFLEALSLPPDWLGSRSQFNPFAQLQSVPLQIAFLAVRLFGLVLMVPVAEELFLRGFLMRIVDDPHWWKQRLNELGWTALIVAPVYGLLTHPGEAVAAVAWFSWINWLMIRTGSFWNCVVAHAITNLILGIYVITFGQWHLW